MSGPQQTLCTQAIPSLPLCLSPRFPQVMPETPGLAAESSNNYSHLQKSVLLLITKPCNPNYTSKEASQEPPSHGQPVSCSPRPSRIGEAGWQLLPDLPPWLPSCLTMQETLAQRSALEGAWGEGHGRKGGSPQDAGLETQEGTEALSGNAGGLHVHGRCTDPTAARFRAGASERPFHI